MDISVPIISIIGGLLAGFLGKLKGKKVKLPGGINVILDEMGRPIPMPPYPGDPGSYSSRTRDVEPYLGGTPFPYPSSSPKPPLSSSTSVKKKL